MRLKEFLDDTPLGASPVGDGRWTFRTWAPNPESLALVLGDQRVELERDEAGYAQITLDAAAGQSYAFELDGERRADPASRAQQDGVHGPSQLVDLERHWHCKGWNDPPLGRHVIYELHVGTFTPEGTFAGVIDRLADLRALGITAVELMPVAAFPGRRNWGYDGVLPFATQASYGGVEGLCELVDAAHDLGMSVFLDVVYNHFGPEGNYLREFGPYFTEAYQTPWGAAINFSEADSDHVRRYFIENALYWLLDCRIDGLRLDAVHAIVDPTALPFLEQLAATVEEAREATGRRLHLIAESADNDSRLVAPRRSGGIGMNATWNDDFHHALHSLLTGESEGYYVDYSGVESLARVMADGFAYTGEYSRYRRRCHGRPARSVGADQLVVSAQNHDQVGNRARAERLSSLVDLERLKVAAGAMLLSPFVPLLFMGEEYGEDAPFHYFIDHGDPALVQAVREGRQREFAAFAWQGELPDAADPATFEASRLDWSRSRQEPGRLLLDYYSTLIALRDEDWFNRDHHAQQVECFGHVLICRAPAMTLMFNFGPTAQSVPLAGQRVLDSADRRWGGPGNLVPPHAMDDIELGPLRVVLFKSQDTGVPTLDHQ